MAFFMPIMSAVGSIGGAMMQSGQQQAAGQAQAQASYFNAAVAQQKPLWIRTKDSQPWPQLATRHKAHYLEACSQA